MFGYFKVNNEDITINCMGDLKMWGDNNTTISSGIGNIDIESSNDIDIDAASSLSLTSRNRKYQY